MLKKKWKIVALLLMTAVLAVGCKEKQKRKPLDEVVSAPGAVAEAGEGRTQKSKQYASQMMSGLFSAVRHEFASDLANQWTEESLRQSFDLVFAPLQGYQGIHHVEEEKVEGLWNVTVVLSFENEKEGSIRFVYDEKETIVGIWFDAVDESVPDKEITISNPPYALTGTLCIPEQSEKPPVVLLLGEDTWDENGTIGEAGNTPLKDLAEGLAKEGIATFRYPMRKYQYKGKLSASVSLYESFLQDASKAIEQLYAQKEIDSERIYIAAMGAGADRVSALVRQKSSYLSGVILMGAKPIACQERDYADPDKTVDMDASYFMKENSTIPLLVMQGKADFETTGKAFGKWKELWRGRSHITYREYEKLNHYFMTTTGKTDATDYDTKNRVQDAVISEIARWCQEK